MWKGWMAVSHIIGIVMSFILLTVLWIVLFGAYALCLRVAGLFRRRPVSTTYWRDVTGGKDGFLHQF
jgi:hypothetical protein